jgi:hypothetical protein
MLGPESDASLYVSASFWSIVHNLHNSHPAPDTHAPLVHNRTTGSPGKSPIRTQKCVQIVRAGPIQSFNNSE